MEDMFITPIQPMTLTMLQGSRAGATVKGEEGIATFKSIFENAINDVRTTDDELVKQQYLLATGDIEDPHSVTIAGAQAQLAVDLLTAVRRQSLEAYNEIMRISSQ